MAVVILFSARLNSFTLEKAKSFSKFILSHFCFLELLNNASLSRGKNSLKIISSCASGRAGKSNSKKLIVLSESVSKFFISSRLRESEDEQSLSSFCK